VNVGTVEAKFAVDTTDWEQKLPEAARQGMARVQQQMDAASKGITAAMQKASAGILDAFGRPVAAAVQGSEAVNAAAKKASQGLSGFSTSAREMADLAQRAGVSTGILGAAVGALTSPFGLAAAAIVAAGLAVRELTGSMVENFRQTRELQALTGGSADAASNLADTYKILGFDVGTASQSLFRLGLQVDANSDSLKLLGVSTVDAAGKTRPLIDVMEEARDRVSRLGDSSAQVAVLMGLLGRGALSQLPVWQQTAEQWKAAKDRAKELSGSIEEAMRASRAYVQAAGEMDVALEALKLELGTALLPPLTAVVNAVTELARLAREPIKFVVSFTMDLFSSETPDDRFANWIRHKLGLATAAEQAWQMQRAGERQSFPVSVAPPLLAGPGFPTIAQAGGALSNVVSQQQLTSGLQNLNIALGHVSTQFQTGAIEASAYRAALAQVAGILTPLAERGLPEAQKQLDAVNVALSQLDFSQFQQNLARAQQAAQGFETQMTVGIKDAVAAQTMSEEQGAVAEAAIRAGALMQQKAIVDDALAHFKGSEAQRLSLQQQAGALGIQLDQAGAALRGVIWAQETATLKAEFSARAVARGQAVQEDLAQSKIALDQFTAMTKLGGADPVAQAEMIAAAEVATAQATFQQTEALNDAEVADTIDMLGKKLISETAFSATVLALWAKTAQARITLDAATSKASTDVLAARTKEAQDELAALGGIYTDQDALYKKLQDSLAVSQQRGIDTEILQWRGLLTTLQAGSQESEQAITQIYLLESKKRVFQYQGDADARKEIDLTELAAKVQIEQQRATAAQRTADLQLQLTAAQQQRDGDYFGFLDTQFQLVLSRTSDVYASLTRLAQDTAQNMQAAFSDFFFNVFTGRLKSMADVFQSFLNSMLRSIANFLSDSLVRSFFGAVTGGGASTAQVAAAVAGTTATGEGVAISDEPGMAGTIQQSASALQNLIGTGSAARSVIDIWNALQGGATTTGAGAVAQTIAGGGSLEAIRSSVSAWAAGASTFTVVLAGVGAALAAFGSIMDIANGQLEAGIGGLVGGVIVGAIGAYFAGPIGAFIGYAIGDLLGSWIGGLFGGGISHYDQVRMDAAQQANDALATIGPLFQSAALSGSPAQVLGALSSPQGPNGAVRSELVLPSSLAAQIGLTGQQIGDQVVTQWAAVTLDQFEQVLAAFREQPDLISLIRGSGDVPFLSQEDAQAVADQVAAGAQSLITAFNALATVRDAITKLAVDLGTAAGQLLPPEIADQFIESKVNPIRDRMLAVVSSGLPVDAMQAQLDALDQELGSYFLLVAAYAQLTQDMAARAGDLQTITDGMVLGITSLLDAQNKAVEDARATFLEAITPEVVLSSADALRTAILARQQSIVQAVAQIETLIGGLLDKIGGPLAAQVTNVAINEAALGNTQPLLDLIANLETLAETAPSAALRLYAIGSAIQAIIAAVPGAVTAGATPEALVAGIVGTASPFLLQLQQMIDTATAGGDLAGALSLLQQEAQMIGALGNAAVAGIRQWETAAVAGAEAAGAAQIQAIELTSQAQRDALQAELDLANQWRAAVQSAGSFVQGLLLGENSPLTQQQKLDLVQTGYQAALTAFQGGPTPQGLSDLQAAAQTLLQVDPTRTAGVISDLQAAIALAPTDNVDALQASLDSLNISTQAQLDAINAQTIDTVAAIHQQATDVINGIVAGMDAALTANAAQQAEILARLIDQQVQLLSAITGGIPTEQFIAEQAKETNRLLADIRDRIGDVLTGPIPAPPGTANVLGSFASGTDYVPRTGLYELHQGEAVKRAGQEGGTTITIAPGAIVVNGAQDPERTAAAVVKELNRQIRNGGQPYNARGINHGSKP